MTEIKKYKNGLTLVVEKMNNFESVSFNVLVKVGSVNETEGNYGISHFIEHMLFKGTNTRTAFEIVNSLESVGVNINAFTDKTETCYYTKSTGEDVEKCVEILSDMYFNSVFDEKEMAREKKVVCEEISMYNDDPFSKVMKISNEIFYNGTEFSRDVAGTKQSVKSLTRQKILDYMSKFYVAQNTIISFAGNITLKKAERLVEKYFLHNFKETGIASKISNKKPTIIKNTAKSFKDNEQSYCSITFPAVEKDDRKKFALKIFGFAFGGGMSSRLFQRIREKMGLVYTISLSTYSNCAGGDTSINFATSSKNVPLALKAIKDEINKVIKNGLTNEEFENSKKSFISNTKISYENTAGIGTQNALKMARKGEILSKKEVIEMLESITMKDITEIINEIFNFERCTIAYVGNNTKIDLMKYFK